MNVAQAAVLGLVQGLTEFLPISSSAHLVLIPHLLGWKNPTVSFDVFLHGGTLLAVVSFFWKDIAALVKFQEGAGPARDGVRRLWGLVILGTIPAAVFGYFFQGFFESLFKKPASVAGFLLITGFILFISKTRPQARPLEKLNFRDSLVVGLAQVAAIAPGISRSGITIAAGLLNGLKRKAAAKYSFLLAIPIILGALLRNLRGIFNFSQEFLPLAVGFLVAFLSGYLTIKYFLRFLETRGLRFFAYYCFLFGGLNLALVYLKY